MTFCRMPGEKPPVWMDPKFFYGLPLWKPMFPILAKRKILREQVDYERIIEIDLKDLTGTHIRQEIRANRVLGFNPVRIYVGNEAFGKMEDIFRESMRQQCASKKCMEFALCGKTSYLGLDVIRHPHDLKFEIVSEKLPIEDSKPKEKIREYKLNKVGFKALMTELQSVLGRHGGTWTYQEDGLGPTAAIIVRLKK